MQLNLDLDGIEFRFRITKYEKSNSENLYKLYNQWCIVELSLRSGSWLNYQISSEVLLSYEVEEIRDKISDFLEDKIQLQEELGFVEPDLTFIINPKVDIDLQIHFWDEGLTANYLSLCFDRNNLECLLVYLRYITKEIQTDDEMLQKLIADNVIRI